MTTKAAIIAIIACCLLPLNLFAGVPPVENQYSIGCGYNPTLRNSLGGYFSTTGGSNSLSVSVNFGELSPINPNPMVSLVVPIVIRSSGPYQVTVSATLNGDQVVELSDIGFGIVNFLPLGPNGSSCAAYSAINPYLNSDPTVTVSFHRRVSYSSSLADVGSYTLLLNGPKLSNQPLSSGLPDNGWSFDTIIAIAPQYYHQGQFTLNLTFTIQQGPGGQC